jgi:hypothetical protein
MTKGEKIHRTGFTSSTASGGRPERGNNENKMLRKIDILGNSVLQLRISWFHFEILHRKVEILHAQFYFIQVYQAEINNEI